jgi:hypothetical protein
MMRSSFWLGELRWSSPETALARFAIDRYGLSLRGPNNSAGLAVQAAGKAPGTFWVT